MKLTLGEARNQLYNTVVPNIDTQANVDLFNQYLNYAQERLINCGIWNGTVISVVFSAPENVNYITLPPRLMSILAIRYESINSQGCKSYVPVKIYNHWYSYITPGPYCYNYNVWALYGYSEFTAFARDLGDDYVIFRDSPYDSYYLKFNLSSTEDEGTSVLIKGYDENGDKIFTSTDSSSYEGMTLTLNSSSITTSQVFSNQLYFLQKQITHNYIDLYAVDTASSDETHIGQYLPSETSACYRRYHVPKKCKNNDGGITQIGTLCKIRYLPAVSDQDEVWPSNIGALRNALTAIVCETQLDNGRYSDNMDKAIKLLNEELRAFRGGDIMSLNIDPSSFQWAGVYQGR